MSQREIVITGEPSRASEVGSALRERGYLVSSADSDTVDNDAGSPATIVLVGECTKWTVEQCRRWARHRVFVVAPLASVDRAVGVMRAGAECFLPDPVDMDDLVRRLEGVTDRDSPTADTVSSLTGLGPLIGSSRAMNDLYDVITRVANTDTSVLIAGETGTGKELVARTLHARSRRSQGPFVAVNCPALTESLLESELFGHCRGAFTDARGPRLGLMVKASGGTLLLDEVGETSPAFQAKLLRALQERVVRPVGSDEEVPFDARVVAATNRDLDEEVEAGRFRRDLFFRINVVRIDVPPLRVRDGDTRLLAETFLRRCAEDSGRPVTGFNNAAMARLVRYGWPGNVRELKNVIEAAVALTRGPLIGIEELPEQMVFSSFVGSSRRSARPASYPTLAEMSRRYIREVLDAVGGRKTEAARILGLDRKTLYRKLGDQTDDAADLTPPSGTRRDSAEWETVPFRRRVEGKR